MRQYFILLFILTISNGLHAQDSKYERITKQGSVVISNLKEFNLDGTETITYGLLAQNERYSYISDTFTIATGEAQDVYNALISLKEFAVKYKHEKGMSSERENMRLSRQNVFGLVTRIDIDEAYCYIRDSSLDTLLKLFVNYCKKKNISIEDKKSSM